MTKNKNSNTPQPYCFGLDGERRIVMARRKDLESLKSLRELRERFISVAVDLFHQRGYTDTSVRDMLRLVHSAHSVFYMCFRDKSELLYVIVSRTARELINRLRRIATQTQDPAEAISEMLQEQAKVVVEKEKQIKIMLEEAHHLKKYKKRLISFQQIICRIYQIQFGKLKESGKLEADPYAQASLAAYMIDWFYRWHKCEKKDLELAVLSAKKLLLP